MDVVPLSLDSPEPLLREWAALDAAIQAELMPDLDPPPYAQSLRNLQPVAHLNRWGVAAVDGAQVVGAGLCRSFLSDNRHLCEVDLYVAKGRRREGIGSALLSRVAAVAGQDGRTTIVGYAAAGSAGLDFATALGAVEKQGELRSSLDVSTLDREALAGELAAAEASSVDYELLRWSGVCPEDLLAAYAGVADAMNDAPRGELDMEDVVAEPERMRVRAQTVLATGARPYVVVARRKGKDWYVGAMGIEMPHDISLPLGFLAPHTDYRLLLVHDNGPDGLAVEERTVSRSDRLSVTVARDGGYATELTPVPPQTPTGG